MIKGMLYVLEGTKIMLKREKRHKKNVFLKELIN